MFFNISGISKNTLTLRQFDNSLQTILLSLQGIRTQIVKSNQTMREPNNEILAIKMI